MRIRTVLAVCLVLSTPPPVPAQVPSPASEDVEAAYLYQFGRYVDWPPDLVNASQTFDICVLGTDPLGEALRDVVAGKAITGRQVAAKRIIGLGESTDCRILFVSSSENARVPEILKALEGVAHPDRRPRRRLHQAGRHDRLHVRRPPRTVRRQPRRR